MMSRALDPETVSSIRSDDSQRIYDELVEVLCSESKELLEIEFLGKSHPLPPGSSFLVDGNNIGISKSKLVQAFIVARRTFIELYRKCPDEKAENLRNATAVMLLMDAEHLTAANTRKRLVQQSLGAAKSELEALLAYELRFVDSYLTSRLHRHAKSPTLWGHRRWVLEIGESVGMNHAIMHDLRSVVLVAAERHPRNYYAWSHMRWLVTRFYDKHVCLEEIGRCKRFGGLKEYEWDDEDLSLFSTAYRWCILHPGDTSGFSFLLFCLFGQGSKNPGIEGTTNTIGPVCSAVSQLASDYNWIHESVWVFLRTLVASGYANSDDRRLFLEAVESITQSRTEGLKVLESAKEWYERYEKPIGSIP